MSAALRLEVISLFPEAFAAFRETGVTGRALRRGLASLRVTNPRDFATDVHRTVDDRPYGGGPGMVMKAEPLAAAIAAAREGLPAEAPTVFLSPQGRRFDQRRARELAAMPGFVLLAGRYEGVDERLIDAAVDQELSLGDYVLSGGELAALVVADAVIRLLPGALGDPESAAQDSFVDGLLDCPHYTRPERWGDRPVPAVLQSGDHGAIARWRMKEALGRTWRRRPDLLDGLELTALQQELLAEYKDDYGRAAEAGTGKRDRRG